MPNPKTPTTPDTRQVTSDASSSMTRILCLQTYAVGMITGPAQGSISGFPTGDIGRILDRLDASRECHEQPSDRRIRGHGAIHFWLRSERGGVGQAVPTDRESEGEVRGDLSRIVTRELLAPRRQRS